MTDETTEHDTDAAADDEQAPEATDGTAAPETDDEPETPNAEAARWRRKLRDTEGERDQLATQLDDLRRQLVEQHASGQIKPAALWASGADLAALVTDGGTVDYDLVDAAIKTARDALGIGGAPKASPRQGTEPGIDSTATWTDALADRQR